MKAEYKPFVDELIELAIKEDIGDGDHTSLCCIPASEQGRMRLLCKQEGVIAGIEIAEIVLQRLDPTMQFEQLLHDGDRVKPGDVAFYVSGSLRSLLQAERILHVRPVAPQLGKTLFRTLGEPTGNLVLALTPRRLSVPGDHVRVADAVHDKGNHVLFTVLHVITPFRCGASGCPRPQV